MNRTLRSLVWLPALLPAPALAAESALSLEAGYRRDSFEWSIAAADGDPNILSELSWRDLEIAELSARGEFGPWGPVLFRAHGSYGYAVSGTVQDSDYQGSDRSGEFSRSNSAADGSEFWSLSAAAGFPLAFGGGAEWRNRLIPLAGVAFQRQDLRLTDGRQTVSSALNPVPLGPIEGLDSRYAANWFSPWLGLELNLRHQDGLGLQLRADYHFWTYYEAEADWNLRQDFAHPVSFRHEAEGGHGLVLALGADYRLPASPWSLLARADWQRWDSDSGTDTVYFSGGGAAQTRFNGAERESASLSLGARYRF